MNSPEDFHRVRTQGVCCPSLSFAAQVVAHHCRSVRFPNLKLLEDISFLCNTVASVLISMRFVSSLLAHPGFTRCLSRCPIWLRVNAVPVVNSDTLAGEYHAHTDGTFSDDCAPFFFRLSKEKMMFLSDIHILGVINQHPNIHPIIEIAKDFKIFYNTTPL